MKLEGSALTFGAVVLSPVSARPPLLAPTQRPGFLLLRASPPSRPFRLRAIRHRSEAGTSPMGGYLGLAEISVLFVTAQVGYQRVRGPADRFFLDSGIAFRFKES
jgi:hypothetical protein